MRDVTLLVGIPTYGQGSFAATVMAEMTRSERLAGYGVDEDGGSLLTATFNGMWCRALNLRVPTPPSELGLSHFLMMHADVRPRVVVKHWFDTLLEEMESVEADVISAAIPIKDIRGLTSIAMDTDPWKPMRLTQRQIHGLPVTWVCENVLFNTGLMLVDFRKPWVEEFHFDMRNRIVQDEASGRWVHDVAPEDWEMSRWCHRRGLRCAVTRAVTVDHFGSTFWSSDQVWGAEADPNNQVIGAYWLEGKNGATLFEPKQAALPEYISGTNQESE